MFRVSLTALALVASLTACAAEPPGKAGAAAADKPAAGKPAPAKPAATGEAAIRAALQDLAPDAVVSSINDSPIPGYREVALDARIVYVSEDGTRLIQGALFDIPARENLTQASEAVLRREELAKAGPDRRIAFPAAKPRHTVTVFTDIDCGYCQKLHREIAEYNDLGISVEYLFYPRAGIGSESFEKAVSVWCAPDRQKAMTAAKAGQDLPPGRCSNPVTQDYDLGRRIGLEGTPAVYSANGTQLGGYVSPAEMLVRLDELAAKDAKAGR